MQKNTPHETLHAFKAVCPLMIVYSLLALAFVVVAILGISLPLNAQEFESTTTSRIITTAAALLGLCAGILGLHASKAGKIGIIKTCAYLSYIMIILYCAAMFLADGHTNPHAWIILGATSAVPGWFGGYAMNLAKSGAIDN